MSQFPKDKLVVDSCHATKISDAIRIVLKIRSIQIPGVSKISDSIVLEGVALPSIEARDLAGRTIQFPVNPEPGYVDGSIYIEHAHHPVDVSSIEFGKISEGGLPVSFSARFMLSHEGLQDEAGVDYEDFDMWLTGRFSNGRIVEAGE